MAKQPWANVCKQAERTVVQRFPGATSGHSLGEFSAVVAASDVTALKGWCPVEMR